MATSDYLLKPEHSIWKLFIYQLSCIQIIRIGMVAIIKLHDMESKAIDVKVDVPRFKVRCYRLPDFHLRMKFLDFTPCGIRYTDTLPRT